MVDFVYGVSSFERRRGNFPALPVQNMFAEEVSTEPGVTLQSRPGLKNAVIDMGSGPVRGLFTADGVLNNGLFGVSGYGLYLSSSHLGVINGGGPVSFAGYEDYVFVNAGKKIWSYDGSDLESLSFPDDADVAKIVVGASRLIALRKDTDTFYWSGLLSTTIDALSFATAENSPDSLKDMLYIGDKLILFGAETIEFWPSTEDSDLPFAPLVGAVLPVGIKGTGMATQFNRTFAWITNYNEVCIGDPNNIVSEPELQVKIANSENVSLWTFYVDDAEYLAVRIDDETWTYGARTNVWSILTSIGHDNWICQCYDNGYFGSSHDGAIIEWSDSYDDFDGPVERRFRAWTALTSESLRVSNVILRTNPGTTPNVTGSYTNPVVELRTSRDGGREWQPWRSRELGEVGNYRKRIYWSSLGQFSFPGVLVEIRVTDPVPFRISALAMNEPFGGR